MWVLSFHFYLLITKLIMVYSAMKPTRTTCIPDALPKKGCNLVCATGWPKSALTKNFSPIGPVVPEIWPNMWGKSQKKRERRKESSK